VAERLQYAPFARGDVITKQGNKAHWLYVLAFGEAEVLYEPVSGAPQVIGTVRAGEFFGEMSLISGDARSATVVAKTDVECYRLDRASFQDLLSSRPDIAGEVARIASMRKPELEQAREEAVLRSAAEVRTNEEARFMNRVRRFFRLTGSG
jgi:CRP-like cAMP-binding protein